MATNPLYSCGCGNATTQEVCGDFPTPANPDLGNCCGGYREKRSCEAPTIPPNPCNDTLAYAEYNANADPRFVIVSRIFDQNCNPILDQAGNPIFGTSQ